MVEELERTKLTEGFHPPCRPDNGGTVGTTVQIRINCWDMSVADHTVLMYVIEPLKVYMRENEMQQVIKIGPKDLRALLKHIVKRYVNQYLLNA